MKITHDFTINMNHFQMIPKIIHESGRKNKLNSNRKKTQTLFLSFVPPERRKVESFRTENKNGRNPKRKNRRKFPNPTGHG